MLSKNAKLGGDIKYHQIQFLRFTEEQVETCSN